MSTDITEGGLERLICTALAGDLPKTGMMETRA